MECNQIKDLMNDYIDNLLTNEQEAEFEKHISNCLECKEELETLKSIIQDLSEFEYEELPNNYHEDLIKRLDAEIKNESKLTFKFNRHHYFYFSALVASFLLITVVMPDDSISNQIPYSDTVNIQNSPVENVEYSTYSSDMEKSNEKQINSLKSTNGEVKTSIKTKSIVTPKKVENKYEEASVTSNKTETSKEEALAIKEVESFNTESSNEMLLVASVDENSNEKEIKVSNISSEDTNNEKETLATPTTRMMKMSLSADEPISNEKIESETIQSYEGTGASVDNKATSTEIASNEMSIESTENLMTTSLNVENETVVAVEDKKEEVAKEIIKDTSPIVSETSSKKVRKTENVKPINSINESKNIKSLNVEPIEKDFSPSKVEVKAPVVKEYKVESNISKNKDKFIILLAVTVLIIGSLPMLYNIIRKKIK